MRLRRALATAAAAALMGAGFVMAPPASATVEAVAVDCNSGTTTEFTVSPGEALVFDVSDSSCLGLFTILSVTDQSTFAALIATVADTSGTGGGAVADWAAKTVVYTAGSRPGTDSLILNAALFTGIAQRGAYRLPPLGVSYYMTVPSPGSAPWLQAYGRQAGQTCATGWSPSWGQWMNDGTGGWTCVREQYWSHTAGTWLYRKG